MPEDFVSADGDLNELGFDDGWLLDPVEDEGDPGAEESLLGFLAGDFAADADFFIDFLGL